MGFFKQKPSLQGFLIQPLFFVVGEPKRVFLKQKPSVLKGLLIN